MTDVLVGLALVVVLSVAARLVASWLRIPAIVTLLAVGVLAGDATGLIEPQKLLGDALSPAISIAVGIILFEGGLGLHREELRGGTRRVVVLLVTLGSALTWVLGSYAIWLALDVPPGIAVLVGAVLIVSGPTVVLPMLEFIRPTAKVRSVLKWEGILVDPVGALVAVIVFEGLHFGAGKLDLRLGGMVVSLAIGIGIGLVGALVLLALLSTSRLEGRDKVAATLMVVVGVFAAANTVRDDAGLMATIVTGVVLANQRRVAIGRIVEFKETLVPILIGLLFVLLAAEVDVGQVVDLGWPLLALVGALVLVVRPLGVALATLRSPLRLGERAFVAALAPRGIVAASTASVFGLELVDRGVAGAELIVPITFAVIACTVVVYAIAAPALARPLGVARSEPTDLLIVGDSQWALALARALHEGGASVHVWSPSADWQRSAREAGLQVLPDPLVGEYGLQESALEGIARFLLACEDDALNATLALRLADVVDAERVWRIPRREDAPRLLPDGGVPGGILFESRERPPAAAELALELI